MELWKDITDYEGLYQVSNFGRVKSLPRNGTIKQERILRPHIVGGYVQVELRKHNISKGLKVHRLVAQAFISNPGNKPEVNHIDGDKHNNSVSNLEWVTSSENQLHAIYVTKVQKMRAIVQKNSKGVPIKLWESITEASKSLGIDRSSIIQNCNAKRKTAGGFVWCYQN